MKRSVELVVACVVALVILAVFVHPATPGPNAPLEQRVLGKVLVLVFCGVLAALILMQHCGQDCFGSDSLQWARARSSISERLALIGFHLC